VHFQLIEHSAPRRLVDAAAVAGLIDVIGSPDPEAFAARLLEAVRPLLHACECTVFAHEAQRPPRFLSAASDQGPWDAARRAAIHAREFDGQDELQPVIERRPAAGEVGAVFICHQPLQDMRPNRLRSDCLESAGLTDRLTVLARVGEAEWLAAHLYRNGETGPFGPDDVEAGASIARLVAGCMARHHLSDPTGVGTLRGRVSEGVREFGDRLTDREREVLTRILDGVTVNRIAEDLKLRPTTVATYRLRAYEKLGVTSRQELFAAILKRRAVAPERLRPGRATSLAHAA